MKIHVSIWNEVELLLQNEDEEIKATGEMLKDLEAQLAEEYDRTFGPPLFYGTSPVGFGALVFFYKDWTAVITKQGEGGVLKVDEWPCLLDQIKENVISVKAEFM